MNDIKIKTLKNHDFLVILFFINVYKKCKENNSEIKIKKLIH